MNVKALQCSVVQTIFRDKIFFRKNLELMEWSLFLWFHRREQHFIALVYCTQVSIYWEILLAVSKLRSKVGKNFLGLAWEKVRSIFRWQSNSFEIHVLDLWIWVFLQWREKSKKNTNSFVRFLGESTARQSAYGSIWPLGDHKGREKNIVYGRPF